MEYTRIEKYVKVTDNWYPNFEDNKIRVSLIYQSHDNFVRICAWGKDDFGLEMDFQGTIEENEAKFYEWKKTIYDKIPEPCNKEYFEKLGFLLA